MHPYGGILIVVINKVWIPERGPDFDIASFQFEGGFAVLIEISKEQGLHQQIPISILDKLTPPYSVWEYENGEDDRG